MSGVADEGRAMSSASGREDGKSRAADGRAAAGRVREARVRAGLTQEQLAGRLGVAFATVNRWENGRSGMSAAVQRRFTELLAELDQAAQPPSGRPPVPISSFVGREAEIATVTGLLAAGRLTSLVGPGGAGKTRLILEVLRRRPAGALRAIFVALDRISDPALTDTRVAAALGLRDQPGMAAAAAVTRALDQAPALLVLDGAEHMLAGVTELAQRVLAEAPQARIVVTSRHVLDVPGEQVWPVPVLGCPAPGAGTEQAGASDAVRLFAARAAERRPGFELTAELTPPVAELCRRLDGLPLAIELAASWTGTLSVGQILDHRLDLLGPAGSQRAGRPAGDGAGDTLHAVAESSHALLGAVERAVLRDLSVFAGPFTLPDATAVTGQPADQLVHALNRLVNSSWLVVRHDQDQSAYRMLDTLREFAAGQLEAAGGTPAARIRHGAHFAALAQGSELSLAGLDRARWIIRLERATADLEAALTWARDTGEVSLGLRMSAALGRWWLTTGRLAEGRRWLAAFTVAAGPGRTDVSVARAWSTAAVLATENGDYRPAIEQAAQALRVFDSLGDGAAAAQATTVLGAAHRYLGEHTAALRYLELAVAHRRRLGDEAGLVAALNNVAMIAVDTGDFPRAQRLLEETLALKRTLGHPRSVALNLANLADVFLKTGQAGPAEEALAEAADLSADLGDVQLAGAIACNQGDLARLRGDFARASTSYTRALECYRSAGASHDVVLALCGLGVARHHLGQPGRAARLLREAEALAISLGNSNRLPEVRAALAETGLRTRTQPPGGLTSRQAEILGYVADGLTSREIAAKLVLSTGTVDRHIATVYRKLGVTNRAQATSYALRHGLAAASAPRST
jgi:predicted ATPase/DNA-binding CsgD family transcriptional regulator/DNA-binding XRE family transcriptional regulator